MKYIGKFIVLLVTALAIVIAIPSRASADTFVGSYNTGSITYAFAGIYSNPYQDQLATYFKQWDTASSRITMSKGSTYDSAKLRIRFNMSAPPEEGLFGVTYLYDLNNNQITDTSKTWYKATCSVYNTNISDTSKKATLAHEVGHAVSMAHCTYSLGHVGLKHIMHQGVKYYTLISSYEKSELTKKWGN